MVCHVRLQVLLRVELFRAIAVSALEHFVAGLNVLAHLIGIEALHGTDKPEKVDLVVLKLVLFRLLGFLHPSNS